MFKSLPTYAESYVEYTSCRSIVHLPSDNMVNIYTLQDIHVVEQLIELIIGSDVEIIVNWYWIIIELFSSQSIIHLTSNDMVYVNALKE